jgi:hypothetical protein
VDFELFDALDMLEREISQTNGLPRWLTGTASPDVDFMVETAYDGAEAALDAWDEQHQGKKKVPGTHRFAVPHALGDEPIEGGLARQRMLLYALAQEAGKTDDDDPSAGLDIDRRRPAEGWNTADYG